ncbi:MAG: U32 family peptidase [Eubacterium sp.]|nr:U32 family peptidase [Eubacterium sp.]
MKTELLAPAGSIDALRAAFMAGADAVYIGGNRFGARAYADNPDEEELVGAIRLAHRLGKKLYMTVNTLFKNAELEDELRSWMEPYYRNGLDGVIVQDFGVVDFFRKYFPLLDVHSSTQMTITGPEGAALMKELGMTRVVPARELSLPEIRRIRERTGLEIESFVHGAMCYSYSGQCLMSSLIGGRSGNRGRCAGVCRLPFRVEENGRTLNGRDSEYPLSMKDMCTIDLIPDMIRAGIVSFKIEGRMKKPEYTAGVVSVYRKYIDLFERDPDHYRVDPADRQMLYDLFNRDGFNSGYYREYNGPDMMALKNAKLSEGHQKKAAAVAEQLHVKLSLPDMAARLQLGVNGHCRLAKGSPASLTVTDPLHDLSVTVTRDGVQKAQKSAVDLTRVRKQLNKTGTSDFRFESLVIDMEEDLFVPMQLLNELRREAFAALDEKISESFMRTVTGDPSVKPERPCGTPKSPCRIRISVETPEQFEEAERLLAVSESGDLFDGIYVPVSLYDTIRKKKRGETLLHLALPYILREKDGHTEENLSELIREFAGAEKGDILIRCQEEAGLVKKLGLAERSVTDAGFYTWNDRSQSVFAGLGFTRDTVPLELNFREIRGRSCAASELVIYGRAPMMISAQCVKKNVDKCTHAFARLSLTDRKNKTFPVQCCCDTCTNIIYNSLPTSLLKEKEAIGHIGPRSLRIAVTTESGRETRDVIRAFCDGFIAGGTSELPFETTKGHFRRGTE